ncbi:MAG TPA: CBS domain-containing protein [Pseudonocardiaceae bacterium]|jgi:Mg/Co/Ni transporter MgtE|nr:CBS domain-containing protein [Pseudonocardiaceae bacterium]
MTAVSRVFVARLTGLPVFGPDGESIGKVRDVVAGLRPGPQPPRALGIVVELLSRRGIFVPMLRVQSIEPSAITLATGSVNLRRFHQRPNEVLVVGQLLDAHVTVDDGVTRALVIDVAMDRTRTRDWVFTKVAVQERTRRLSRRGPVKVLAWEDVDGLALADLSGEPQGAQQLLAVFDTMRAVDVASALLDLPVKRRHEVIDALDDERLADVLEELPEDDQKDLLAHLHEERAADVLEAMNPDDAADLLAELPEQVKDRLLALMEPEESAPVKRLLQYSFDTAGGLMTPEPVVLSPDATIAEALALVRNPDLTPALASMVFVCRPPSATPTGRYLGCVHLQQLLRQPPSELVAGALDSDLARLSPTDKLTEVTRYFAAYNLVCGPVVDDEEHLLGAVTVDDVLDHLLPEDWRENTLHDQVADEIAEKLTDPAEPGGAAGTGDHDQRQESSHA